MIPGAFPVIVGEPPATVDWTDSDGTLSASSPTHTFSSVAIGTAHATRQVFVATYYDVATAVTVGGISASVVVSATGNFLRLWRAAVPTGTTASIAVTSSGTGRLAIQVWAAYNLRSTTPHDTAAYSAGANATTHTTTINKADKGILIAAAGTAGNPGFLCTSWTGATLRNNRRLAVGSFDILESAADSMDTASATGATLRSTWDDSVLADMVGATYR